MRCYFFKRSTPHAAHTHLCNVRLHCSELGHGAGMYGEEEGSHAAQHQLGLVKAGRWRASHFSTVYKHDCNIR